ncbi:hypothetical protein ACLOJK_021509 [Asimina triloba]
MAGFQVAFVVMPAAPPPPASSSCSNISIRTYKAPYSAMAPPRSVCIARRSIVLTLATIYEEDATSVESLENPHPPVLSSPPSSPFDSKRISPMQHVHEQECKGRTLGATATYVQRTKS